ncbi:MAG: methyltransferase domain-containing protein [Acidobacteria bacterium]|nr:methyltransferase domain-containing protein [Acidobacteriota bacterium]
MVKSKRFLLWVAGVVLAGAALVMLVGGDGESEVDLLAALLEIQPGDTAADIGAGSGWLSIEVARLVGGTGQVFATELSPQRRDDIQEAVAAAGLDNVTVVEAGERETNLAPACCDAIFMRRVYHHVGDTAALNASIRDALKPGGRFVVIEIEFSGLLSFLRGWPHWTDDAQVVAEVTAAGLDHVTTADWPIGAHYAAVFRKP